MQLHKVYRFKVEPNAAQTQRLYQLAGARRFVYNWALARRKEFYRAERKSLPAAQLSQELTALKQRPETLWLQDIDAQSSQQALRDLDRAFRNFFARRAGFPKFQSKKHGHFAFRIPQRVKVDNGRCYCPKIGWIRIRQSQAVEGITKSATFKRDACGDWFVILTGEFEMPEAPPVPSHKAMENAIGVDLGLKDFVTLSNGDSVPAPRFFRKAQKKLARAQRVLSRRQRGSRRRGKAKAKVARIHRKALNQRSDFVHKTTITLVRRFDVICIEDLNVKGLAKTKLSKSIHDVAFGEFRRQLHYKTLWHRKHLAVVSRWFPSSKLCGSCGAINHALTLSDRTWECGCGVSHHRDHNAALNILVEGTRNMAEGHSDMKNARGQSVRRETSRCSG